MMEEFCTHVKFIGTMTLDTVEAMPKIWQPPVQLRGVTNIGSE